MKSAPRGPVHDDQLRRRGHIIMLVATVLIATSFPVGAAITHGLDPVVLTFLRFTLAAALFAPLIAWRYGLIVPGVRDLARYGALSLCLVGFFWGMFAALRYTSALNTATIFTLLPLITALVAMVVLKQRLGAASRWALPVGAVGALWVIVRGDWGVLLSLDLGKGDAIFLAATGGMALYAPLVKRLHRGEPMAVMTFWTLVTGSVWLLVLAAPRFGAVDWATVSMGVYVGVVYLAIFTTLVSFFAIQWSSVIIGPTKTVSYTYLHPMLVLIMGVGLGENLPSAMTYPGFVLIFAAIYILLSAKSDA